MMPIYAFKCKICKYQYDEGMDLATYSAAHDDPFNGFRFKVCGRCKRKGTIEPDTVAQAQTQSVHADEYVFYENAPDEILRGQHRRTVTKAEAKRLMDEHGMAEAGISAKITRRTAMVIDKDSIAKRWEDGTDAGPAAKRLPPPAEASEPPKVPWADGIPPRSERRKKSNERRAEQVKISTQQPKVVDILGDPDLIIGADWLTLKRVSKKLKLNASPKTKRPELERQIRAGILKRQAAK